MHKLLAVLTVLALAACSRPNEAKPAMWEVTGPGGEHAWLFGTIHMLPRAAEWRSRDIDQALASADMIVLEIANIEDTGGMGAVFTELANSPGQPPLSERVDPSVRPALQKLYAETKALLYVRLGRDGSPLSSPPARVGTNGAHVHGQ